MRYIPDVAKINYDKSKCSGCGRCTEVCPHAVFTMKGKKAVLSDKNACMECGACDRNCPFGAIKVESGVGCAAALIGAIVSGGKKQGCCG